MERPAESFGGIEGSLRGQSERSFAALKMTREEEPKDRKNALPSYRSLHDPSSARTDMALPLSGKR